MAENPLRIVTISGMPDGYDALRLARKARESSGTCIHILKDDQRLAEFEAALRFLDPGLAVLRFPAWDCLPYDRVSPHPDVAAARMATLAALAGQPAGPLILLTTISAAIQRVPPPDMVKAGRFLLQKGAVIATEDLRSWLARSGYIQSGNVRESGEFAIRGGIIDLYPPGSNLPIRLDFFGDQLEALREFDPASQMSRGSLAAFTLAPVSEVPLDEASIRRFRQTYRIEFGTAGTDDPLYEAVSAGRRHQGFEHWAAFFHDEMASLFSYLPKASLSFDGHPLDLARSRWEAISAQYQARAEARSTAARLASPYRPARPELLYIDPEVWEKTLSGQRVDGYSPLPLPPGPDVESAGAARVRNFAPERQAGEAGLFPAFAAYVASKRRSGRVLIAAYSDGSADRFATLLQDEGVGGGLRIADFAALPTASGTLALAVWPLESGFEAGDLTVIAEQDVLGERLVRPWRRRRKAENALTEAAALSPGDLVVHADHGIGLYRGLETITALGAPHECIALEYAGGDRLFLPVENIELLSRYGEEEAPLDRLGGVAWQSRKARMRGRIREIAAQLIRTAAERATREGVVLTPPEHLWDEFCARFPWQETEDQLAAIADVLGDLSSGRPMDRLVCGDVGFGKTEVALRAAFIAAMAGHQVAIVAPTTLLARQHARTFAERFRGLPLRVAQLSRFVHLREAEVARQGLAEGTVDIVVGTHALLAQSVRFQRLGLIIIDEEQKFGVVHKERLKELKAEVHVLTMTATPIPRTLQLALSGVRELSLIATPPVDRLAVRTYVSEFDPVTVREALLREHYRGGQSFYVVPRVADIADIAAFLTDHVPEVSFVVAHGQMAAGELDRRMNDFYDGKFGVLLATSIVESGLDIPAANTLVVHRADMFGLAQLYQIRGRVGRAKLRAYAYFTTPAGRNLTPGAEKRLKVLGQLDALGAGFSLASQDLDIRGAGNLLGDEQSGHVREVGYELYQDMLQEEIMRLKAGRGAVAVAAEAEEGWSPQINLGVPVLIPEAYVPDLDVRLGLYRRLSSLKGKVEFEGFAAELIDRFGALPREVTLLMNVMRIKAMCRRAGISRLDAGPKGATIGFHRNRFANPAGLAAWMQAQKGAASVRDNRLVLKTDWPRDGERIKGVYVLARDLAGLMAES
jgi:transcription-repair coupling factor (superfamily II helicase)